MLLSSFILVLTFLSLVSAHSAGDVVLAGRQTSGNTTLTGDQYCSGFMCISAVVNGSAVEYTLSSTGKKTPGWMGMGFGTEMSGTEMVIMWSNSDGSITMSQRNGHGHSEPAVNSSPTRIATLSNNLSSTSGSIKFVYTIPANSDTQQNIIYGFGTTNPNDKSASASIQEHYAYGTATLDLTKAISGNSSTSGSPSDSETGTGTGTDSLALRPFEKTIVAHGIFCVIGFLLFMPAGALLARYFRTFTHTWFRAHWICQFLVAGVTVIIGGSLGFVAANADGAPHFDDDHKKWGVGLLILYAVQCGLGAIIHFIKPKRFVGRPPQNYIHAILGIAIIGCALFQTRSGLCDTGGKSRGT